MPQLFGLFREMLDGKVAALDFLVALGTHPPMDDAALSRLVGVPVVDGRAGDSRIFNHEWADPATFATIGEISAAEIARALRRTARAAGPRLAQPADLRLRPDHHLRPGLPARGRRLLRRQQVLLPRHRRRRRHQLHALARRAHHQLRDHRLRLHAGARRHRPRGGDGDGADRLLRAGGHARGHRRPLLRLGARGLGARVGAVGAAAHRLARRSRCARCCR